MSDSLKQDMLAIIEGDKIPPGRAGLARILEFLSRGYGVGVRTRNSAFRRGILPQRKLPCRVISIGNLTAGGTGKTPMTLYVAQRIRDMGYAAAVVSRGYMGHFEKHGGIVSDGSTTLCSLRESGDEPFMLARILSDVPVVVGKDRYGAGMTAVNRFSPDVIILDDAFQHQGLYRDLNLVLVDRKAPLGNGHLLPRGRLREPLTSLSRSHAVIFTRADRAGRDLEAEQAIIRACKNRRPVFFATHLPVVCEPPAWRSTGAVMHRGKFPASDFSNKTGLLVSAIADNAGFRKTCENMGLKVKGHIEFPDHYWYKNRDLETIAERFVRSSADILVTTEKDAVKFPDSLPGEPELVVLGVRIGFDPAGVKAFDQMIEAVIKG
ncbi:MAG: tetraacyldisaccharide 4'-kinase [Pseudomonadota bacterium]